MSDLTAVVDAGQTRVEPAVANAPIPNGTNGHSQQATETKPDGQMALPNPSQAPGGVPEGEKKEVWDGNPLSLPENMQEHGKAVQRYATKIAMETAEARKLADQFRQFQNSDQWKNYQSWEKSKTLQPTPPPQVTSTDIEEALSAGDPAKLEMSIQRRIQEGINQAVQQYLPVVGELQQKQVLQERQQEIEAASDLYPDFWDLYEDGLLMPMVQNLVDSGKGGTIHDAILKAREVSSKYEQRALQKSQGRINEKKNAVSSTPSPAHEPETVYATDPSEARRLAFEAAWNNKRVNVKTKKK